MDLDILLTPFSPNSPAGPDLEYDPDFMAFEQASLGKPERQTGQVIVPAEEPDWPDIQRRAESLLSRSKDLRVAIVLVRAAIHCEGMAGLASGLKLLQALLVDYWETIHPALDPEDGDDAGMRLNVLAALANPNAVLRDVRGIAFASTGSHARLSVRDVLIAMSKLRVDSSGGVPSQAEIEEILRLPENAVSIQALWEALAAVDGIHLFLGEKVGYDRVPDMQPLKDMLKTVAQLGPAASHVSQPGEIPMNTEGAAQMPADGDKELMMTVPGEIRSREDAVRMLEKICEFIERTEPANPAPLFIRRGQRLMTKNFVEILQELAPESLNQLKQITGIEPKKS
jgi:type VI secretion system protein ImpA